ncbi:MAG: hypothetical protein RLZZ244_1393, partial [Verrucomicrobiota bacterium]
MGWGSGVCWRTRKPLKKAMNNRARVLGGVLLALFGVVILIGGFVALRSRPSVRPEAEHGVAGGDRGRESSMASATASTPSTGEPEGGNGGAGSALSGPGKGAPKVPGVGARKYADFDRRQERGLGEQGPTAEQSAAVAALRREVSGLEVQFDPVTRSANHVMALGGFLSGGAQGMESLKRFVDEHAVLFGHKASVLDAGARVLREDENAHNGMRSLVWQQELDGVPLYETILRANLTREGELITMGSHFVSDPSLASGMEAGERNALVERSPVDPARAVALAAANVDQRVEPSGVRPVSEALGAERRQRLEAPGLSDVNAGLAWLPTGPEAMQLVWDVIFTSRKQREMFRVLVDARTGEVWKRTSLTRSLSNASYRVHVNAGTLTPLDSPRPMSPGLASPGTTQPPEVARSLVTLSALDPVASPNGWIADGGTRTFGNNVDAHLDLVDSDPGYGEGVHAVSATRTFDFPLDLTSAPSASRDAAITTLFYLSNWYHDKLYALGFTESAGNFQQSNFSKGGRGGDAVLADAQDGGGT